MLLPDPIFRARAGRRAAPTGGRRRFRFQASVEVMLLACSAFWVLLGNVRFFTGALAGRSAADPAAWGLALALGVGLIAQHALLLAPFANRHTVRPLLSLLIVGTAFAAYYVHQLNVYLDPSMLRNTLRTDWHEARELLNPTLLPWLLFGAVLPLLVLWRTEPAPRRWPRALAIRLGFMAMCALVAAVATFSVFGALASTLRNQKELRYLITPANYLWSGTSVLAADLKGQAAPRKPIGEDAAPGPRWAARTRPLLVVMVVGETARAANWGLSGYARQTTPQLSRLPVINFADVTSCGTNTEVSVPCMFAPVGRRDHDESTIRGSESLLHVLARAGVGVTWRDNQSGCKGVCEGLPYQTVADIAPPGLCAGRRCLDEGLLHGLPDMLQAARGPQLLVLHQLGNHGPAYFKRYPPEMAQFKPACEDEDLRRCPSEHIVNAYDNALLYTDHVLARLIGELKAREADVDSMLVYVSDHGESLGEKNLYLHGLPYAIAPDVQKQVPMVMWFSSGFAQANGLDLACMKQRATQPAAHDHLFHTVLGLLDVRTALYQPAWDLGHDCRSAAPAAPDAPSAAAAAAAGTAVKAGPISVTASR